MLADRRFWIVFVAVLGTAVALTFLSLVLEWPEWSTYISAALAGLAGLVTARLTGLRPLISPERSRDSCAPALVRGWD